jgi:hypothetical protein
VGVGVGAGVGVVAGGVIGASGVRWSQPLSAKAASASGSAAKRIFREFLRIFMAAPMGDEAAINRPMDALRPAAMLQ